MNLEEIKELRELRKEKANLIQKEKKLTEPVLHDLSLIPKIYEWFSEFMDKKNCKVAHENVIQRKKFLFVIISLYCPKSLTGAKMPNGIRNVLNGIFNYKYASQISYLCSGSIDLFIFYKSFRCDVQDILDDILIRLKDNGYI